MTTSDPTAPDAVAMLQRMHARAVHSENRGDVPRIGSAEVLAVLRATQAERARHAEEVARLEAEAEDHCDVTASLRDQLRKAERERDDLKRHYEEALECDTEAFREQLRPLDSLRSLLPDVMACAEYVIEAELEQPHDAADPIVDVAKRLYERSNLAALDSHECPECHRNSGHKLSCSRGGSKGGRFGVRLDSQGGEGECLDRSDARGVAGDRCESGNECGRLGCPECQS